MLGGLRMSHYSNRTCNELKQALVEVKMCRPQIISRKAWIRDGSLDSLTAKGAFTSPSTNIRRCQSDGKSYQNSELYNMHETK
jgi:hypothetical protein